MTPVQLSGHLKPFVVDQTMYKSETGMKILKNTKNTFHVAWRDENGPYVHMVEEQNGV